LEVCRAALGTGLKPDSAVPAGGVGNRPPKRSRGSKLQQVARMMHCKESSAWTTQLRPNRVCINHTSAIWT